MLRGGAENRMYVKTNSCAYFISRIDHFYVYATTLNNTSHLILCLFHHGVLFTWVWTRLKVHRRNTEQHQKLPKHVTRNERKPNKNEKKYAFIVNCYGKTYNNWVNLWEPAIDHSSHFHILFNVSASEEE